MRKPIVAAISMALLAVPLVATSASAARPSCDGKRATIVGETTGGSAATGRKTQSENT